MTILATIYNQKSKVYNQSVKNTAFFFLIIYPPTLAIVDKTYFAFIHIKEHSPIFILIGADQVARWQAPRSIFG
jgi:hypothetical protein